MAPGQFFAFNSNITIYVIALRTHFFRNGYVYKSNFNQFIRLEMFCLKLFTLLSIIIAVMARSCSTFFRIKLSDRAEHYWKKKRL